MIDIEKLKLQIIANIDNTAFENARKAQREKDVIGGFAYEISEAVLKSDMRMYKREVYAYNGKYYEQFDFSLFYNMVIDILMFKKVGKGITVKDNGQIAEFCRKRLIQKDINPSRTQMPFQNFVLDTKTLITYPHTCELDVLYALPYDYDPDADCPLWKKFLAEVLPGEGLINILQEYLGLLFVDRDELKLEKMLILYGSGANGKSVVFETIIRILGEENVSFYDMAQLTKGKASEANLADIDGKMLNYASDLDPRDFSGGVMKRLISGEKMQGRKLYRDPMTLKLIPLFICNANELPETTDRTNGFFRRVLILPFDVTIKDKDQDKALSTKLRGEYPGILNWILEGTQRIVKNGINFTESKHVDKASEEYKIIQDSIFGFINCNRISGVESDNTEKYWIERDELYEKYSKYCDDVTKKPFGKNRFLQMFKSHGFETYKNDTERGFVVNCARDPRLYWNLDIGNVYDDENSTCEPQPEPVEEFIPVAVQGDLPF